MLDCLSVDTHNFLFTLAGLRTVTTHDSAAKSVVSSSQTKRYVDIWNKAAIGRLAF